MGALNARATVFGYNADGTRAYLHPVSSGENDRMYAEVCDQHAPHGPEHQCRCGLLCMHNAYPHLLIVDGAHTSHTLAACKDHGFPLTPKAMANLMVEYPSDAWAAFAEHGGRTQPDTPMSDAEITAIATESGDTHVRR